MRTRLAEQGSILVDRSAVVAALRAWVDDERERLRRRFELEPTGTLACRAESLLFDVLLAEMHRLAGRVVEHRVGAIPAEADLCLAAVGGYGRAALAPWSDIDVVFIPAHEQNEAIDAVVREMLLLLNDTLVPGQHPQVAHSYRPLADLGLIDHQTATALLESRFIAGNDSLHVHFMQSLLRSIDPVEFLHQNLHERRLVWDDPTQSVYAVEPNLKSGPGGLRDFHAGLWVAKVVYGIQDWDILGALRDRGTVSWDESNEVMAALEYLLLCRNWLHRARGRKLDVVHVEYQDAMGRGLGFQPGDDQPAEQLMRRYYESARQIHAFARRLFGLVGKERIDYQHGTHVVAGRLYANHEHIFREEPTRLVRVYEAAQRFGLELSLELEKLIVASLDCLDPATANRPAVGASFLRILGSERNVADSLRAMQRGGVLDRLLPEFAPLMTYLPGDPAHEYTVGEHSLKVVEEIQRLRDRPIGDEEGVLSQALKALQEPEVLFLAALFHDVGKMDPNAPHSVTGSVIGAEVARRLGLHAGAIERLRFLILEHLTMMRTARLRALLLPETIEQFVAVLPEADPLDALDMLVVLSSADAHSVGQSVFRENERRMLMDLFGKAAKWIQERPLVDEPEARERLSRRLSVTPALRSVDPELVRSHLDSMPTWYAVNTPPALIAKHIEYLDRLRRGEHPVVEFYHALQAKHTELTVCTRDRPGLLRDIAAAVTANNLDIYLAHSDVCAQCDDAAPEAIATIWVEDFGQPLGQVKRDRLRADLVSILNGRETAGDLLARRGKAVHGSVVLHDIRVNNTDSRQHTVITVRADDRKGLLYLLTQALADEQLDIMVAKVTTWRGAAEDAFYVVGLEDNRKLDDDRAESVAWSLRERLTRETAGVELE